MENNNQPEVNNFANMMPDYSYQNPFELRVGFGRRLGAFLIDYLIFSLIFVILLFITGRIDDLMTVSANGKMDIEELMKISESITPLILIIFLIYYSLEAFIGATLGKLTLGIKIASSDMKSANLSKLLIRFAVKNISTLLSIIAIVTSVQFFGTLGSVGGFVIFIGYFFVLSQKKQGFHDMVAGTAVFYNDDILK